ncbi:hypothetical protein Taro_018203 [Colocasia esculenta]|uniref:Uncharacterized protein n=1 Tax=Colocasia esculenta TaxID=4460 RepID=A0A843UVG6_COLES|nr:hypothetical protein [Colocasia esculenta]
MAMTGGASALATLMERIAHEVVILSSVVVRRLFRNASLVGYLRFFVSQARVLVVLGVGPDIVCTVEVCVVFLDTLTHLFELYVRLRERRQWATTCVCGCAVVCNALVVGGTDTSIRHWSQASPIFQCLTLGCSVQRP